MKKAFSLILIGLICLALFGCGKDEAPTLTVGYICIGEQLLDRDINQVVWKAITDVSAKYEITAEYTICKDYDTESVKGVINDLYAKGCRMIYASDYKLATALSSLQKSYKDCKFICLDFSLSSISSNSMCIAFAEYEAAFVAAVAAATELKSGQAACILGMDLPSSQKYLSGLKNGFDYANRMLGANVTLNDSDVIFIGSYNDPSLAYNLAEEKYTAGINCIFTDGLKSGDGVYAAAINARKIGLNAYVIGNKTDNFDKGIYESSESVSLVSAAFDFETAVKYPIERYFSGSFQGGKLITLNCATDGIALPCANANLSQTSADVAAKIIGDIKNGTIVVKDPTSLLD